METLTTQFPTVQHLNLLDLVVVGVVTLNTCINFPGQHRSSGSHFARRPHFPQSIMQDFNNPSSGTFNGIAKGGGARGELFPLEKGLPPSPSIAKNYRPKHWDPPLKGPRLNTCEGSFKRTAKVLRNMHVPRALAPEGVSMHRILNVKLDQNHVKLSSSPYTPFQPGN